MNKKVITGLIVAAVTSVFYHADPASASTFTWDNLTSTDEVKSYKTDNSGFQSLIPELQKYVQKERLEIPDGKLNKLDPTMLKLKNDHDVRVWFINEGAGFKNQVAYEAINGSKYNKKLIFNDASCYQDQGKTVNQACEFPSEDGVLNIGDYVDLGKIAGGTQLNFFLKANGKNGGQNVYGADANTNPDKLDHLVAYEVDGNVLLGFEDLFGPKDATGGQNELSDRDFNDVVVAVEFGKENVASVPEPGSAIALVGVGAVGMLKLRRRCQNQAKQTA